MVSKDWLWVGDIMFIYTTPRLVSPVYTEYLSCLSLSSLEHSKQIMS